MQRENLRFYLKIVIQAVFIFAVCWFFMICRFWFGNHEWGYLKSGVSFDTGFFEARYSQHIWTLLLQEGHILPVMGLFWSFIGSALTGILAGKYMEIQEKHCYYLILALAVGLNPHIYSLLYYVFLWLPFSIWPVCAVAVLFLAESPYGWLKFISGALLCFLLLGSYPPVFALTFALFCGKCALKVAKNKQAFKQSIEQGIFFAGEFAVGYIGFKVVYKILQACEKINPDMYNLKIASLSVIVKRLLTETGNGFLQFLKPVPFLDYGYCILTVTGVIVAVVALLSKKKLGTMVWLVAMFAVSRFSFIVAENVYAAVLHVSYFGKIGILLWALGVLLTERKQWIKNLTFVWSILLIFLFIKTDAYIQKVQYFGFQAERLFHSHIFNLLENNTDFDYNRPYIVFAFGQPVFRRRYYEESPNHNEEMLDSHLTFTGDILAMVFWDTEKSPDIIVVGHMGDGALLRIDRSKNHLLMNEDFWKNNPENIKRMRWWMYQEAVPGMWAKSLYIDDKYLILALDKLTFLKYRELVLTKIDK